MCTVLCCRTQASTRPLACVACAIVSLCVSTSTSNGCGLFHLNSCQHLHISVLCAVCAVVCLSVSTSNGKACSSVLSYSMRIVRLFVSTSTSHVCSLVLPYSASTCTLVCAACAVVCVFVSTGTSNVYSLVLLYSSQHSPISVCSLCCSMSMCQH
jgi:hypothetical protein